MHDCQFSDWIFKQSSTSPQHSTVIKNNLKNSNASYTENLEERRQNTNKWPISVSPCLIGFIIGTLSCGIILGIILTLWLTSTTTITTRVTTAATTTTTTPGCHLCNSTSYSASCNSCTEDSTGCVITCLCKPMSGSPKNTSIQIQPGTGNGCNLGNNNGELHCGSYCT